MKMFSASCMLLLLSIISIAQTVAVSADKMNLLYIGVENPITIAVTNSGPVDFIVTSEGCSITNIGSGKYIARCTEPGVVTIFIKSKKTHTKGWSRQYYTIYKYYIVHFISENI